MAKKINPKVAKEIEALIEAIDEEFAAAQSPEEARAELKAMGIDPEPFEKGLKSLLQKLTEHERN